MSRLAYCLTPYRLPGLHTMMLTADDVAALWNGYLVLWHPAIVRLCSEPPQLASPYDHEQPNAPHIYTLPETPPLYLPDDWSERVRQAGGVSVTAGVDRQVVVREALAALGIEPTPYDRPEPFYALGLGYALLQAFFEGMQHPWTLSTSEFWNDVKTAAATQDENTRHSLLQSAAQRLRQARETLYSGTIYVLAVVFAEDLTHNNFVHDLLQLDLPWNVVASGEHLECWAKQNPETWEKLRQRVIQERVELCAGPYHERPDALLPIGSQLWNLRKGMAVYKELVGGEPRVFARKKFGYTPSFPAFLHRFGLSRMLFLPSEQGVIPEYRAASIEWTSPDGHRVEAITRKPLPGDDPLTYFHWAYHVIRTIREDTTPNLVLTFYQSSPRPPAHDWLELHSLASVLGELVTATRWMNEIPIGEYPTPPGADDFHSCYLDDLVAARAVDPVGLFMRHHRQRRALEAAWTLAALWRVLMPSGAETHGFARLRELEAKLESGGDIESDLAAVTHELLQRLAERLLSRAQSDQPGHLLFNVCPRERKMVTTLDNIATPLPSPAKATQPLGGGKAEVVVQVPGLGFAWLPNRVAPGTLVALPKTKLAEGLTLRNEYFEAEVDEQTGGLRAFRDYKWRNNRIGEILAFGPGSDMRAEQVEVTSSGPSRGEIVTRGVLLNGQQRLARFQQRFRIWRGYPLLVIEITLEPESPVEMPAEGETPYGATSAWHAAYVARWAWRDPQTRLFRAVAGIRFPTQHTRPETAEYVEVCTPFSRTTLFTGGLPFLQRHSQRMLDVILLCPGERTRTFELALGLELSEPGQLALEWLTPSLSIPVSTGPPHVGTTGWLAWLDAENVALFSLRVPEDDSAAWLVQLQETRGVSTECSLRCPRNPVRAYVVDEWNQPQHELTVNQDAVQIFLGAHELLTLRVEFA
ncbi:MAG: hypothetical protein RMI91_03325 [Gemmatales bacterium]|nr:hypothetical protein [Gemmatales bacterium]MDW7993662.1 hypothetical protein [Gemmatales bacterium]